MSLFSALKRDQKEAIGLLQIGTLLEYFDLMLYVHMAVLLNELFFPKTDPHTTALLTALTFCSTFVPAFKTCQSFFLPERIIFRAYLLAFQVT